MNIEKHLFLQVLFYFGLFSDLTNPKFNGFGKSLYF